MNSEYERYKINRQPSVRDKEKYNRVKKESDCKNYRCWFVRKRSGVAGLYTQSGVGVDNKSGG